MPRVAWNDAGEPFLVDDGTQDVPRLPTTDWSLSNLITNNNPNQPTLFPSIREGLSTAGQLLTGQKPLAASEDIQDRLFGFHGVGQGRRTSRQAAPIEYGNRLKTWPEQMVTNAIAGDAPSWSVNPQTGEIHTSPETIERALDISGMAGGGFAAKPNAIETAALSPAERLAAHARQNQQGVVDGRLMSDTSLPGTAIAATAPRFYSALENAVKNSKTKIADANQWLGELRNQPGVKQEELDWVLHDLPQGQISKPDLEQYVNEHKIELKEVNKGLTSFDEAISRANSEGRNRGDTRHSQWQLPGGEHYQEMLLTLPDNKPAIINEFEAYKRQLEIKYNTHLDSPYDVVRATGKVTPEGKLEAAKYADLLEKASKAQITNPSFKSSHWDEPNVLAHIRTNERVIPPQAGGRNEPLNSLHVEEIQSDWHQKGRKAGYRGEKEDLQPKFDAIEKKILDSNDEAVMSNPELKDALADAVKKGIITADEAKTYARYTQIESGSPVPDAPFKSNWADLALKRIIRQAAEQGKDAISWTPGEAQASRYDLSKHVSGIRWEPSIADKNTSIVRINQKEGGTINLQVDKTGKVVDTHQATANQFEGRNLADIVGKEIAEKITSKENGFLKDLDLKVGGEGMKTFYDKMLVDKANAIAKKFGGKVEQAELDLGHHSQTPDQPVHVLRITPQLRDAALNKGFSLFADSGKVGAPLAALTRVEHNPFTVETYHGGPRPFKGDRILNTSFDVSKIDDGYKVWSKEARKFISPEFETHEAALNWIDNKGLNEFYHTTNRELANYYSEPATKLPGASPHVLPLKTDIRDYHVYDAQGKNWAAVNHFAIGQANQLGKKGVIVKNVYDGGPKSDVYITLDPSTVRSRFAKFDPAKFGESGLLKAAGIPIDISNQDGKDPFIDNSHDVPYGAGASNNGFVVHIDKSIPDHNPATGDLDLHKPLALHERTEKPLMEAGMPYELAHKIATNAEKGLVEALGGNWKEYEKVMDGYLSHIEHENPKDPPKNLYLKPYPHDKQQLLAKNATKTLDEQNASPDVQPLPTHGTNKGGFPTKGLGLAALKAAEYGVWIMRPATGPYLWAVSIPVGAVMNASPMKERREGMTLHRLKPVSGNPFEDAK